MKKFLILIITIITAFAFTACSKDNKTVNVYVVDGAPTLAVANLMSDIKVDNKKVKVTVIEDLNELKGYVTRGEYDFAVCPVNLASTFYNSGLNLKLLSVNVFGVLHVVGKTPITLEGLKGKTLYNIGQGGTPDITIRYLLNKNNIEFTINAENNDSQKVNIKYVKSASELIGLLKQGKAEYGIIGEPAVKTASEKAGVSSVIDLTKEWYKVTNNAKYTQAGVIVNGDFYNNEYNAVKEVFSYLNKNNDFLCDKPENVIPLIQNSGSNLNFNVTKNTPLELNLNCCLASDIKSDIESYLTVLYNHNPSVIGGKLPDNNFYANLI